MDSLVCSELAEKLNMKRTKRPKTYKVSWLQKTHQMLVNEQCEVYLQLGIYKDRILCDVMPMEVCHIFLGRPWKYDRNSIHEAKRNVYKFQKDGLNQNLLPLQEEETVGNYDTKSLLMRGK